MRVLIVDDEPPARRELRRLLAAHPDVVVGAEAGSCPDADAALAGQRFDLVFLDVKLRRGSGFDLVPAVPRGTAIVFVTAFDRFAIHAFEESALDYLLKPVEPVRLAATLARAAARRVEPRIDVVRVGVEDVPIASITHVTADGDYSVVHTADGGERLVDLPLHEWERRLPPGEFLRIHRATLVHLRFVERLAPAAAGGWTVHLRGVAAPLTTSRRRVTRVRRRIAS